MGKKAEGAIPGAMAGILLSQLLGCGVFTLGILGAILGVVGTVLMWKKAIPAQWVLFGCILFAVIAVAANPSFIDTMSGLVFLLAWGFVIRNRMLDDVFRELATRNGFTYEPGNLEPGRVVGPPPCLHQRWA